MTHQAIHVELRIPRSLLEHWPTPREREGALRAQGLFPPHAEQVRWRVDYESAGYLVEFVVSVRLDEALHP